MKIATRQICFILLIYTAVSRLLIYPTALATISGRDFLFSAAIDFAVSTVVIWSVAYLCSKTDKTFFELLENTFGNVVARIVYGVFALLFMLVTLYGIFEQKLYVHAIFYDTVPSLMVFLPFFAFAVYAGSKGFANVGRSADICLPIFVVCFSVIIIMAFPEARFSHLLPVLKTPAKNVFGGALSSFFRFVEPCWLLMFMGHFKYKKGDAAKLTVSYIGGCALVLLCLAMFYGIYGDIAPSRNFAVSKISLFFSGIDIIGRIDLIALYVLEIVMLFALALNIQLAVHCVNKCTGYDNKNIISLAVNAVLLILLVVCDHYFNAISEVYYRWMWIALVIFAIIIPLLAWALRRRGRRETH